MDHKRFIGVVFIISMSATIAVGTVNFVIDPGHVYFKKYFRNDSDEFSKQLFHSQNGLVATGWNERVIKASLANHSDRFDCVVLGSSRIMQISRITDTGNIQKMCPNLLNLGVSGGSLEDIAVFTDIIMQNTPKPKKVFIGIDPWTFKFGMDARYQMHEKNFDSLNQRLAQGQKNSHNFKYELTLLKNLFNFQYFKTSLSEIPTLYKQGTWLPEPSTIQRPKTSFSYDEGYTEPVTLPDGSHLYASEWIDEQRAKIKQMPNGGGDYKISANTYDPKAVEYLKKIVQLYRDHNVDVSFIVIPYHPKVFNTNSKTLRHITEADKIIKDFSHESNVPLYGSFFPRDLNCKNDEFYDFMHPTKQCLDKIHFQEVK